ncbi:MAG: 3'(2'),5'-bisphosphate nucleotidase CysQ family protein [Gemmatimonadota bacterium]
MIRESVADSVPADVAIDLETAALAAVRGGRAAMKHYRSDDLEIADKGRNNPVTEADHSANRAILDVLAERAPEDPVLSEESARSADVDGEAGTGRLWIVDPLDGTKEFLAQNGEFSVMVGLAVCGRAVIGALFLPDPGTLFIGWSEGGAWSVPTTEQDGRIQFGEPARLRLEPEPDGIPRLIRSRSHSDPLLSALEQRMVGTSTVLCGSVGVKCARIASNQADVYVHPVSFLNEWDTCAPQAVLTGAGGKVTDCGGGALTYGKPDPRQRRGIFAARSGTWDALRPMVREIAAPMLEAEG